MTNNQFNIPEAWKAIPDFPEYQVSNLGNVFSNKTNKCLKQCNSGRGYPVVTISNQNHRKVFPVHRLVLISFVGFPLPHQECRHLDGNKNNNIITNLEWGTRLQNINDRKLHGIDNSGNRHGMAKLNSNEVISIRKLHQDGYTYAIIADIFSINYSTVGYIVRHDTWKHI